MELFTIMVHLVGKLLLFMSVPCLNYKMENIPNICSCRVYIMKQGRPGMLCPWYFKWDLSKSECCINLHSSLWKRSLYTDKTSKPGNILQVLLQPSSNFRSLYNCRTLWSNNCQLSLAHSSIKPLTRKFPTFSLLHRTSNHHNMMILINITIIIITFTFESQWCPDLFPSSSYIQSP